MSSITRRTYFENLVYQAGLAVGTWAPGDGVKRYRFFRAVADSIHADYHEGDGIFTALGRKDATMWLRGYLAAVKGGAL